MTAVRKLDTLGLDRRGFLAGLGATAGGLVLGWSFPTPAEESRESDEQSDFRPNVFIRLAPNGDVTLVASRSEMGQGVRTALPMVLADEMEADWARVTVVQAPAGRRFGDQATDGSRSVLKGYLPMRHLGAAARVMLITAAARRWGAPESECRAETHRVIHDPLGRTLSFGDLATDASALPVPPDPPLKDPDRFRYVGRSRRHVDLDDMLRGRAVFTSDMKLPGMKYAAMARCPVVGGRLERLDKTDALRVRGVLDVVEVATTPAPFSSVGGVGVIAENSWAAERGKAKLELAWEDGPNGVYDSEDELNRMAESVKHPGRVVRQEGDVDAAFAEAHQVVESAYQTPLLAHASMEPPTALAWVHDGTCEIWAPVQVPQGAQRDAAHLLGIDPSNVTVHVPLLGGGFGRKAQHDFVLEAVALSRDAGAPVKLTWSREDDIRHDLYHAMSAHYLKAGLNERGGVTAWLHRSCFPTISSLFRPGNEHAAGFELDQGFRNVPFAIDNVLCENHPARNHVRIAWLRSVCNHFHSIAINCFADELALAAGRDPLEHRLELIGADRNVEITDEDRANPHKLDTARLKEVLRRAAANAGWGRSLPPGHGLGLAVHYSFHTFVAHVAEVSVLQGRLKVHRVDSAVDCGRVINPDTVTAQVEGSVAFGLSACLYGEITARAGRVEQGNFHDYRLLRIHEMPEVRVEIVKSDAPPTGIGEPGVPPVTPAVLNALCAATGKRIRRLPVGDQKLS